MKKLIILTCLIMLGVLSACGETMNVHSFGADGIEVEMETEIYPTEAYTDTTDPTEIYTENPVEIYTENPTFEVIATEAPSESDLSSEFYTVFGDVMEITDEHVFVNIHNTGFSNVMIGLEFDLERYDAGIWVTVPRIIPYTSPEFAISIEPQNTSMLGLYLVPFMPLENGIYRMRKSVWIEYEWIESSGEVAPIYELITEFEWQK